MTQIIINTGRADNDGTGDTLRIGMIKVNQNFTDIYTYFLKKSELPAAVLKLTANNTLYVGSVTADNVVSNAQLSANLSAYELKVDLPGDIAAYLPTNLANVQSTKHFSGTFGAANVSGGSLTNSYCLAVGNSSANVVITGDGIFIDGNPMFSNSVLLNQDDSNDNSLYLPMSLLTGGTWANAIVASSLRFNPLNRRLTVNGSISVGNSSSNSVINSTSLPIGGAVHNTSGFVIGSAIHNTTSFTIGSSFINSSAGAISGNTFTIGTSSYFLGNGNVGVGISSPTVNNSNSAVVHIHHANSQAWAVTHYTQGNTGSQANSGFVVGTLPDRAYLLNYEVSPLIFGVGGSETARIDASGNVGIGISSPGKSLDVSGDIRASASILVGANVLANTSTISVGSSLINATYLTSNNLSLNGVTANGIGANTGFVVQLEPLANGFPSLPAVDGSKLLNLPIGGGGTGGLANIQVFTTVGNTTYYRTTNVTKALVYVFGGGGGVGKDTDVNQPGNTGGNSVFLTLKATGGLGAGKNDSANGANGYGIGGKINTNGTAPFVSQGSFGILAGVSGYSNKHAGNGGTTIGIINVAAVSSATVTVGLGGRGNTENGNSPNAIGCNGAVVILEYF